MTILAQTVVSPIELRLRVNVANRAVTGSRTITVSNAPAAQASIGFTINPPRRPQGALSAPPGQTTTITITGSGFVPGPGLRVAVREQGITVGAVMAATTTSITVQVTVGPSVPNGSYPLGVQNPDGGRGSCRCLSVAAP